MRKILKKKKNGFTLVELLIAILVGGLVMLAVYMAMVMSQRTSAGVGRKVITQQDTRAVLDIMASEIAMASFNPLVQPTTWTGDSIVNLNNCGIPVVVANPLNKGIFIADANNMYIAMDLNADGVIGCACANPADCSNDVPCAGQNEFILYSYNPAIRAITRRVSCGQPVSILGNTALGSNVINQDAGIPLFQYFDRFGQPLPLPINIPAVRRVKVTIVAETADIDLNTRQRKRMIYSTDVIVRNHAAFSPNTGAGGAGGGGVVVVGP